MCWTPNNSYTITHTMHYFRQHNCVVGAIIEQDYSSTFKCCLLKIHGISDLKRFTFTSKCTKMHLVARLHPDPLGELTALPRPSSWIKGGEEGQRGGSGKGEGEGEGGREEEGTEKREGEGRTPNV